MAIKSIFGPKGSLQDIEVEFSFSVNDRPRSPLRMLGEGGPRRELSVLDGFEPDKKQLPVLLGAGFGHSLERLLKIYNGPLAVVDKEKDILALTGLEKRLKREDWLFIAEENPQTVLSMLTRWQAQNGYAPFFPLAHPFYLRLDRAFYGSLRQELTASAKYDFWAKARKARFKSDPPRLLLLTSRYFLMGELVNACKRLGIPCRLLSLEDDAIARREFIENLLKHVLEFEPDCILTLNHLGVDREGVLMELLERLNLPLASWFVDNPLLILHLYEKLVSPLCAIFTWDADNVESLRQTGFEHVFYLPLATDPRRFALSPASGRHNRRWRADVSFVGNSMIYKVAARLKAGKFPKALLSGYRKVAARFGASSERSVRAFILSQSPAIAEAYENLPGNEAKLAYETALTWEATRQYRLDCVRRILPFSPIIAGDPGWRVCLRHSGPEESFRLHRELGYYDELPEFYPCSAINFNCTSKQMKGAVNQRIFDVPATGSFVLTDWREQIENLFIPGKEIIFYNEPDEIGDLIKFYLARPKERARIAALARERIMAEHTWEHRVITIIKQMRSVFGSGIK